MRPRSSSGSTSSRNNPLNDASVQVARSEPEAFTHRIRAGRPRKSISSALAEVLPPPQLQIERSAPSLRERATNCANIVDIALSDPFLLSRALLHGAKLLLMMVD